MDREIGGYLELDTTEKENINNDELILLNSGRNCLSYLIESRNIRKIAMPYFMCDSCDDVIHAHGVKMRQYSINNSFKVEDIILGHDEWLYVVNYYGQLTDEYIINLKEKHKRVILDNTHSFFAEPIKGIDTIYSCRKYFGVPDGALLYTECRIDRELDIDYSYTRLQHILGRYEKNASDFFEDFCENERIIARLPLKKMSRLTQNMLNKIDYESVKQKRSKNFEYLYEKFADVNELKLINYEGAYMYPLLVKNGKIIREKLIERKIYVPCLWPVVLKKCDMLTVEYNFANNILPLPIDQRYDEIDMEYVFDNVMELLDCDLSQNS